jgi:hypothetical protein
MKIKTRTPGIYLLLLFLAAPCIIGSSFLPGSLSGAENTWNVRGDEVPGKAGGEHSGLITVTQVFYIHNALETRIQIARCVLVLLAGVLLLALRRILFSPVKYFFIYVFTFLHYLFTALLLSGHAPPRFSF